MQVDLNADVGEGCGNDEALMHLVSSANIACGWHAGDAGVMLQTVRWALDNDVAIGAHPSFPDRDNFGRTEMQREPAQVYADVLYQLGALDAMVRAEGGRLSHIKPHGALYNQAARDRALAQAIVDAVQRFDKTLVFFGLAGSVMVQVARASGLRVKEEVFADRGYNPDGSLVRRGTPGALHDDEETALAQTLSMVRDRRVRAIDGSWVPIQADTICLHGDGAHAVAFARRIRMRLEEDGVVVRAG
ncbi:UPF0271 protein [Cupriavidus gilardii J11]|uniref:5-oxoprolinase subunit A n=1 Tax=Cupriavidus gilardii J11 TaxID=936133 RepID=A0A562BK44_9BURK|nr:5-oxoprolinase subunit PxpA [Cupriavidus gilardii]TWG85280.1 UPF0271 protein [Cupriavidus gilardii J11]